MKTLLKKIITTRIKHDLNDGSTLFAIYVFGRFLEACKYDPKTKRYIDITEHHYVFGYDSF